MQSLAFLKFPECLYNSWCTRARWLFPLYKESRFGRGRDRLTKAKKKYFHDTSVFFLPWSWTLPRHQDLHNQVYSMVIASTRWLAVRADLLCAVLISAVAFTSVLLSQHPGKWSITATLGNFTHCLGQNFHKSALKIMYVNKICQCVNSLLGF